MYAASTFIFIIAVTYVRSHPALPYWSSHLNPVHGLYVKPSSDGITGDLFVAATENNGVKSQWAFDKPVNYLQYAAPTQSHPTTLPAPFPGFPKPHEDTAPQKRAVAAPAPSQPVQYAYAIPVPSSEGNVAAYPYAYPVTSSSTEASATKCDPSATAAGYPFQFPFQFFYPHMMSSAYSNAMTILKDAGMSEDNANAVMGQTPLAPMTWPTSPYAYPMYVMVDPSAWLQSQATTTTSTPSPSTQEEETTQAKII